jgi:hypothetical protein
MSELTVILKDSERTYRKKFLAYEDYTVSESDSFIKQCIEDARKDFLGEPEEVTVKISISL